MEFVALGSAILHAGFIAYGQWQDANMQVKYTDIDYWVLADAAELVIAGESPYKRPTFRYSPLLAYLLTPNRLFGDAFGKVLFSSLNLICSFFIYDLLRRQGSSKNKSALVTAALFACNPMVLAVTTRGNAESVICTLNLMFVWLLARKMKVLAAITLGVAVHVRMFPLIYLPTVLVFMGILPEWAKSNAANPSPHAIPGTPVKLSDQKKSLVDIRWKHVQFVALSVGAFSFLTSLTYYLYGKEGIVESIIYHLTRKDHRHNFSPYWLMFYHNATLNIPDWISSTLPFIPQALLSLVVSVTYGRRDFCFGILMQTFLFVSMNKYFLWYLSILPICIPSLKSARLDNWVVIGGLWLGSQAFFLGSAYKLEFKGEDVFEQTWLASLFFLFANTWIAKSLILIHSDSRIFNKAI